MGVNRVAAGIKKDCILPGSDHDDGRRCRYVPTPCCSVGSEDQQHLPHLGVGRDVDSQAHPRLTETEPAFEQDPRGYLKFDDHISLPNLPGLRESR